MQIVQDIFKTSQEKMFLGNIHADMKDIEQVITKGHKTFQQLSDVLVLVGTLQIIRRHIAYQLNTSCKFDSAQLEASLRTMNELVKNFNIFIYLLVLYNFIVGYVLIPNDTFSGQ